MSSSDLQSRLNELQESIKQTAQLIIRLSRTQPNEDTAEDDASELAADIRDSLRQDEQTLELILQDCEDAVGSIRESGHDENRNSATCQRLGEDLQTLKTRFRKARLQAKKNAESAIQLEQEAYMADLRAAADALVKNETSAAGDDHMSQSEVRAALFVGRRGTARNNNSNQTKDDMLLTASSDLTTSLRRTHDLIKEQLSQSRFAHETLEESNEALKELNTRYGSLDDLLSKSRGLLGSLLRSQKSDTWYLETARWTLAAVIAWLLFRRLLYGPLWWLVYLPMKLASKFAWSIMALIVRSGTGKNTPVPAPAFQSSSRPALIIQKSASGRGSANFGSMRPSVQVGAGGAGVKHPLEHRQPDLPFSERITQIIDSTTAFSATATISAVTASLPGPLDDQDSNKEDPAAGEGTGAGAEPAEQLQGSRGTSDQQDQAARRGDGTLLPDRDEVAEPRNPKKRMMEEPPAAERQQRDEL